VVLLSAWWAFRAGPDDGGGDVINHTDSTQTILATIEARAQDDTDSSSGHPLRKDDHEGWPSVSTLTSLRLWNPLPPTESKDQHQPVIKTVSVLPPPGLTLLGIIHESDGTYRAVIYDQRADRVHIVTNGESIDQLTITRITANAVDMADGPRKHRIVMSSSIVQLDTEEIEGGGRDE